MPPSQEQCNGEFATTHWSAVLQANDSHSSGARVALEHLCRSYWHPLYFYVRRKGHGPHDAQDLTQEFFARLLRLNSLEAVAPHKGRFRTFLLASLNHFLADHRDAQQAAKRGGGQAILSLDAMTAEQRYACEPTTPESPEALYDRRWVTSLLENALERLRTEFTASRRETQFEHLRQFLQSEADDGAYARVADALGITPGAVAVAVHRLRQRYRDLVRTEITQTVSSAEELADEWRHLFGR